MQDRRRLGLLVALVLATRVVTGAETGPLGPAGTVAVYQLEADPAQRPDFERERKLTVAAAELRLGPVVPSPSSPGDPAQWVGLQWARLNGQQYQLWLLLDRWPTESVAPCVSRYLWQEPGWPDAVEYLNVNGGGPLLPRLSLWHYGWPQEIGVGQEGGKPVAGLPERLQLQGWSFRQVRTEQRDQRPPERTTPVALDPDLIVGHMTRDTDEDGKPFWALPDGKYRYRKKTDEDHRKHHTAGFTLFQATPRPDWLTRSSAWDNNLFWLCDDWPAQLYRSNYWGRGIYVDEPAIHNRVLDQREDLAGKLTPAEAAKSLQERLSAALWPQTGNYSKLWINDFIDRQFGRGNLWIVENDYPVWEAVWTTAWYQLAVENGVAGVVDEDVGTGDLVESYNRTFGTQIPPTVENACAIRVAVLRGAARNFGKRWGVAFYSPAEPRLKAATIPILYGKGASYFWVWTGWVGIGDNSGLPYSYQRYYASLVREAQASQPHRDLTALLRAAKVCIVIPYGFTFAPYPLQYLKWLHLERQTGRNATYRQVLANAAVEAERCLRQGLDFDIAVDDPKFTAAGYDEVILCREDGSVVVRAGGAETRLPEGRQATRPDLGPGPSLTIEAPATLPAASAKVTLKALAVPGTGEFVDGKPVVTWEIYGPDQGVTLLTGEQAEAGLPREGLYRLRAAVADVFGRPAVAWHELRVTDPRHAIPLPTEWAFRTDPTKVGENEGWFRPELDDSDWPRLPVPSWWENTSVGAYDGVAWYRVHVVVPADMKGQKLTLEFGAVDEEAWVYLNGQRLGEHTVASTGKSVNEIWDDPFALDVPGETVRWGEENVLTVRISDSAAYGGLYKPVRLLASPRP